VRGRLPSDMAKQLGVEQQQGSEVPTVGGGPAAPASPGTGTGPVAAAAAEGQTASAPR
jgi:hypothetical protein